MKVIEIAKAFVGEKELSGNVFKDTPLGKLLHEAGQKDGEAWCCYLQEALFCEAYVEHSKALRKLFSANCVKTLENFTRAGYAVSGEPKLGALMIMQKYVSGKAQATGHAGLVIQVVDKASWVSVEGNTNEGGSRDGTTVLPKTRSLIYPLTGLRVAGFVDIIKTLKITT